MHFTNYRFAAHFTGRIFQHFNKLLFLTCLLFFSTALQAQAPKDTTVSAWASKLKKLSIEELMSLEVTGVTRTPQKFSRVASAIQVITGEDIRRSAATRLPDALRLAPNLMVAQVNSADWAITARGFNGASLATSTVANKLLVIMDGRPVYSPLFGGVFWDVQNLLMEDVDRIEVISGPGGVAWGVNAVNGVINIVSKSARESQGLFAQAGGGSFMRDFANVRWGGKAGNKVFYRIYGQFFDRTNTTYFDTVKFADKWNFMQGGFRVDYYPSEKNTVTLQGDVYNGNRGKPDANTRMNGQNIMLRWNHTFSERSTFTLQALFDRSYRKFLSNGFVDELKTYDIEFQHNFMWGRRQKISWGGNYRMYNDKITPGIYTIFNPPVANLEIFAGFLQDEIAVVHDKVYLTLGTKLMSNYYSGFEWQPSGRLAYTPTPQHTIWTAVSRAIRGPSRFDVTLMADRKFKSEKVIAYELGYRTEPHKKVALSLSGFYNQYYDLRSLNKTPPGPAGNVFGNDQEARTWGVEFSGNFFLYDWWRIRTGYTYFNKKMIAKDTALIRTGSEAFEGTDPQHQFMLQSIMDIKKNFQVDVVFRLIDSLPGTIFSLNRNVPLYAGLDVRLAYNYKAVTVALVGQDILYKKHVEFQLIQIPWSIYGRVTIRI